MSDSLDDLSYDYEEEGTVVRKQLDRVILTTGPWATVMFLYQELDRPSGQWRAPRMSVVRFKKARGAYRKHCAFNVTTEEQARKLIEVFERWRPRMATDDDEPEAADTDF